MLTGEDFDFHCHSNLTRAVLPFGLVESDVHDVLNVFQVTGLDREGRYFMYVTLLLNPPLGSFTLCFFTFVPELDLTLQHRLGSLPTAWH